MGENEKTIKLVNELKEKNYTLVGSRYFFTGIEGFTPHDYDFIKIVDKIKIEGKQYIHTHIFGVCVNNIERMNVEELIKYSKNNNNPFIVVSLLIPELCEEIGCNFFNYHKLILPLLKKLPKRYSYYIVIYNSYLKNGKMKLTNEQRQQAYLQYIKYRQ
jgi:hypothetical protein